MDKLNSTLTRKEKQYSLPISYKKNAGFTLIELLIALAIGSLLLGGIASFLTSGLEATRKTTQKIVPDEKQRYLDKIMREIQFNGITSIQQSTAGTGYLLLSNSKNYLIKEVTGTGLCNDGRELQFQEITEIIKNGGSEPKTASGGQYRISDSGYEILSGSTVILGTGVQGGKIAPGEPLYTELGGVSSLSHSGNTLYITDPINHRLILLNTSDTSQFTAVDTLDFGVEYPISAAHTTNGGVEIIGNEKAIILEDRASGTFTGSLSLQIENTGSLTKNITELQAEFNGASITSIGSIPTMSCSPACTDPTDIYTLIEGDKLSYIFTGATTIIMNPGDSISMNLDGVTINYLNGSGAEYYGELRAQSGSTVEISDIFHYSTVGDNDIFSTNGNTIVQTGSGINLRKTATNYIYNSGSLDESTTQKIGNKIRTSVPSKNLIIESASNGKGFLISYDQYQNYDCTNSGSILKKESFYIKKTD